MTSDGLFFLDEATPRTVSANGAAFSVLEWVGGRPAIVLLHPNRTNARVWDFFVAACDTRHGVLAPELRGHGDSSWEPSDWSIEAHLADMVAVIRQLVDGPCLVVGAATGGNLALLIASEHPDIAAGIAVVDPGLSLDRALSERVQQQIAHELVFDNLLDARDVLPFSERWTDRMKDHFTHHSFEPTPDGRVRWKYSVDAARTTEASLEDPIWDRIHVSCPTLIVRGDESPAFSSDRLEHLVSLIPGAVVEELNGVGHRVAQDAPERLADAVMGFAVASVPGFEDARRDG